MITSEIIFERRTENFTAVQLEDLFQIKRKMSTEKLAIEGWRLVEIPVDGIYCFYKKSTKEAFDIESKPKLNLLVPFYHDETKEEEINQFEASSIKDAISKYII